MAALEVAIIALSFGLFVAVIVCWGIAPLVRHVWKRLR